MTTEVEEKAEVLGEGPAKMSWPDAPKMPRTEGLPEVIREKKEEDEFEFGDEEDSAAAAAAHLAASELSGNYKTKVSFFLNGKRQSVSNLNPNQRLVNYIRGVGLTGTQTGCGQGACGACSVVVSRRDPQTGKTSHKAVNSCLYPLGSVDGCEVTTIEGVGGQQKGYHPIQQRMARAGGTQCGFCTPGFVNQMYGLLLNNSEPDEKTVENRFQGNLCRCTGYRAIFSAMRSFCKGADSELSSLGGKIDPSVADNVLSPPLRSDKPRKGLNSKTGWYRPNTLSDVFAILAHYDDTPVKLVVGNTARAIQGFYPPSHPADNPGVYVDISRLRELLEISTDANGLIVGGSVTIADLISAMNAEAAANPAKTSYFAAAAANLGSVATPAVRAISGWAGNLVLAKRHPDFPSDILTILKAADATIGLVNAEGRKEVSVSAFLNQSLSGYLIQDVRLPYVDGNTTIRTYHVRSRKQNAHSVVAAGFKFELDEFRLVKSCSMDYSGVGSGMTSTARTEEYLTGKPFISHVLKEGLEVLADEIKEAPSLSDDEHLIHSAEYRQGLALNLFYKFFLSMQENLPPTLQSALENPTRERSDGTQIFSADKSLSPVSDYIPKIEGLGQTAGELNYTSDIPNPSDGLHAAPVLTSVANGTIESIDVSDALASPGVVDYIGARDIEDLGGLNEVGFFPGDFPVFATKDVLYDGQMIGVIVAKTPTQARRGASLVDITYQRADSDPITTISDALDQASYLDQNDKNYEAVPFKYPPVVERGDVDQGFQDSAHVVTGTVSTGTQDHWYMETQSAAVFPEDGKLKVSSSCQAPSMARDYLSGVLGKKGNDIIVTAQRAGGGFGGKSTGAIPCAAACAVAATKLQRPVRMRFNRNEDMRTTAKREAMQANYKVGYNDDGKVVAIEIEWLIDGGCSYDFTMVSMWFAQRDGDNCYNIPNVRTTGKVLKTNGPTSTPMRAPGHASAVFFIESIMEVVAQNVKLDPADVRELNFYKEGDHTPAPDKTEIKACTLHKVWPRLKDQSNWTQLRKEVDAFNKGNKWKKRGLSIAPLKYGMVWAFHKHAAMVNISETDGAVQVTHSGTEIGQGINTKVAQAVAYKLGIEVDKIVVPSASTDKIPNMGFTGGSTTSETCCKAAMDACDQILERLAPIKEKNPEADWKTVIQMAGGGGVLLSATGWFAPGSGFYHNFSGCVNVVELDVLTGEVTLLQTDIVYDAGQSMNPAIDIGQIEGGFIQGLGLFQLEDIVVNKSGKMVNASPWNYHVPDSHSIPSKFNVTFLDEPYKDGILSSKATGEPAVILAQGVLFAIQNAVKNAQSEEDAESLQLSAPLTFEKSQLACKITPDKLTLD